ncbi:MAG TPA: DNA cytosine methyltransferase [Candidatus Cybelea sp.]|nr:DNA cytosine methyltransferase [Candidatus Cybelea sp.]
MAPLAIDLFCGLGGWTEGLLAEGWGVVGFDIECHVYGGHRYPAQLVIQDVLTLHGSQFRSADLIVASPPCQEFSYMAMPWTRAKEKRRRLLDGPAADRARLTALFDACFRIQREASEAAGRHVPMVVENVRGAQEWVGRARWSFGSFYLWGDVPALLPMDAGVRKGKGSGGSWYYQNGGNARSASSKSAERREWSAKIAKVPLPLSRHVARCFLPHQKSFVSHPRLV